MKIQSTILLICLLFTTCTTDEQSTLNQVESLFSTPKSVPLNIAEGYTFNMFTGDSIKPLLNQFGDTVITGKPIPAIGQIISDAGVVLARTIKAKPPKVIPPNLNVHKIPESLTVIPIDHDALTKIKFGEGDSNFVLVNEYRDTIPTGVPILAKGKKVHTIYPQAFKALSPTNDKNPQNYFQYLDEYHGLVSTDVRSMLQDTKGNIWFGTFGSGVSRYDGSSFTHFSQQEGLSKVIDMLEDKNGNIWFGTVWEGVFKYDGSSFTHFTQKEGLCNDKVNSILEDKKGNLWFGTNNGVSRYDGSFFTHFTKKEGLSSSGISGILEDEKGNIWFGTYEDGVIKYDGSTFTHFTKKHGLMGNSIWSMLEDHTGNLWFGSPPEGLTKYDGDSFTHFTEKEGLSSAAIFSMFEDTKGNIWFGTADGGVNKYDGRFFTHFTEKEGLGGNWVHTILEDKNGIFWFGTLNAGLSIYDPKSFSYFNSEGALYPWYEYRILEDKKGNIWLAAQNGGICKFDGSSFNESKGQEGYIHSPFLEDKKGNIWFVYFTGFDKDDISWVGQYDGSFFTYFAEKELIGENLVYTILEDKKGNIWIGTVSNGLYKYDGSSFTHFTEKGGLSSNEIRSILEDQSGNIWFGTWAGLHKYDGDSFTTYTEKEGLSSNIVSSMMEDKKGNIWIGTKVGLSKYDGDSFTTYTEKEGLSSNEIRSILEDQSGNLWIGTPTGLTQMEFDEKNGSYIMKIYNKQDGIKGLNFSFESALIDSRNRAWWGTDKSVAMLDLNTLDLTRKDFTPKLNDLTINDEFLDYRNLSDSIQSSIRFNQVQKFSNLPLGLTLAYNKNNLIFHYSVIDLKNPHKIEYSYVMEGIDANWTNPGKEAKAVYRNLSHGSYTFKVRAKSAKGQWSEGQKYEFTILPPWWQTWWARTFYILFFLGAIWRFIKWRTQNLKRQKEALEQTVKERTIELEEEKVRAEEQKERAERSEKHKQQFLANMSHEIRTPMHAISGMVKILKRNEHLPTQDTFLNAMHTSSDNLVVILNDVLDLSKIEAGKLDIENIPMSPTAVIENITQILKYKAEEKGLQLNYQIDDEVPDLIMGDPTRLNQILINLAGNAIKFTEKGSVDILLTKENDQLRFAIRDTGIGIPKDKVEKIFGAFEQAKNSTSRHYGGTGLGLNISKQLVELQQGKIWAESEEGKGSTFFVELPIVAAAADAIGKDLISEDRLKTMAASLKGIRILLAEDNAFNQMIAQDDLSFYIEDVKIDVAENGALAVEKFQTGNYDLILMDVQMPEMNGFEATRKIRELEKVVGAEKPIPIIAMTASLLKSEVDNCYTAGMDNYIPKPYKAEELIGTIYEEVK